MGIFNNVSSLVALNYMNRNIALQGKSMTKISTGLRINKAADDAAGLAISEKMRAKIRGLEQGNRNVQDGISLVQVTDSAMEQISNILGRINELAIESANGTLNDEDREKIDVETKELMLEISDITEDTNFNGIEVLQGKPLEEKFEFSTQRGMPIWVDVPTKLEDCRPLKLPNGTNLNHAYSTVDFSNFDGSQKKIDELLGNGFFSTCCTCDDTYNIRFTDKNEPNKVGDNTVVNINISGVKTAEDLVKAIVDQSSASFNHFTKLLVDPDNPKRLIIYDERDNVNPNPDDGRGVVGKGIVYDKGVIEADPGINIQYGNVNDEYRLLHLPNTSLKSLGIENIDLSTQKNATLSIPLIKDSMEYINIQRSKMGSYQNVLEVRYSINTTTNENLVDAESRIRDVDVAKEMINISKVNIIAQASMAMLAQSKQQYQSIINLLK